MSGLETLSDKEIGFEIVAGLSVLIARNLSNLASEQTHPGADADASDDKIKKHSEAAERYRLIRDVFENVLSGMVISDDE